LLPGLPPDPLLLRSAGGIVESVEHVLFECPALSSIRPTTLQEWNTRSLSHRQLALAHSDTATFVRTALARLGSHGTLPSSSVSIPPTASHLYRPPANPAPSPPLSRRLKPIGRVWCPVDSPSLASPAPPASLLAGEYPPSTPQRVHPDTGQLQSLKQLSGSRRLPTTCRLKTPRSSGHGSPPTMAKKGRTRAPPDAAS
jgi:hypothetical protein